VPFHPGIYGDSYNRFIGPATTLVATETWQTTDYGKVESQFAHPSLLLPH
jgi:hypothetical protein